MSGNLSLPYSVRHRCRGPPANHRRTAPTTKVARMSVCLSTYILDVSTKAGRHKEDHADPAATARPRYNSISLTQLDRLRGSSQSSRVTRW
jgi:hypothetical protein